MSGYVRIHRCLFEEHPAFRNDAEAMAFAWLIAKAQWQPRAVRYKERKISLKRGQVAISQRDMGRALDRDKAWVERLWKRLRDEAMITVDSEAGVAVITICNYDQYQSNVATREAVDEAPDEADARQGQGTEQIREEVKKISSEPNGSSPRARFPAPPDVPDPVWADFLKSPKRHKAGMSQTAYAGICHNLQELAEHGFPPGECIATAVERGWTTVKLDWMENERRPHTLGRNQPADGLSSTARAAMAVFGSPGAS